MPPSVAQAAQAAANASKNQWTPGSYGIWVIVLTIAGYIVRQYVPWFRAKADRDNGIVTQLQALVDKLQGRIDGLESDIRDERRRCDEEMAELRKRHDEESRSLHDKLDAMQRIIIQWQVSTGRMIELPPTTSASSAAIDRVVKQLDERTSGQ